MSLITNYATLQTGIINELLRPDFAGAAVQGFIRQAEQSLRRDPRVRQLVTDDAFVVDAASEALPTAFKALEQIVHNGPTYYHPLELGTLADLSRMRQSTGATGFPRLYALMNGTSIRFAPVPDGEYTLLLDYWQGVPYLSDSVQDNWLVTDHSDIYLYSACLEAAPYLKEDPRIATWAELREARIIELDLQNNDLNYSGPMARTPTHRMP